MYRVNTLCHGKIVNVENYRTSYCHINDSKLCVFAYCFLEGKGQKYKISICFKSIFSPKMALRKHFTENLTQLPEAGEVFAVDLGDGLFRAVRNDLLLSVSDLNNISAKSSINLFFWLHFDYHRNSRKQSNYF